MGGWVIGYGFVGVVVGVGCLGVEVLFVVGEGYVCGLVVIMFVVGVVGEVCVFG